MKYLIALLLCACTSGASSHTPIITTDNRTVDDLPKCSARVASIWQHDHDTHAAKWKYERFELDDGRWLFFNKKNGVDCISGTKRVAGAKKPSNGLFMEGLCCSK